LLSQDPDLHAGLWEMISGLDREAQLSAIALPTLVAVSADDINAPVSAGEKLPS